MKKIFSIFLTAIMIFVLAACGSTTSSQQEESSGTKENNQSSSESKEAKKEEKVTLKLATPDPDSASVSVAAKEFAKLVSEKTDGTVEISVHPNGTLYGGDPSAGVKQLGAGSLDMLVLSTSLYANFEPKFSAISIPYVFDDRDQFVSFLNGKPGTELMESVNNMNIEGLGYWTRTFRQITNSKQPIEKPEDLEGIKLRVPNNPLWVEFFKGTGAVTTPMDFGEVYNALQLGTIDGQENPVGVVKAAKLYEVQKYLTISNHMADGWVVGMNKAKFNKLSESQQKAVKEAAQEIQQWKLDKDATEVNETIEFLKSEGVEVNTLTPEQVQAFVEVSKQAYPEFKKLVKDDEFFSKVLEFVGKSE